MNVSAPGSVSGVSTFSGAFDSASWALATVQARTHTISKQRISGSRFGDFGLGNQAIEKAGLQLFVLRSRPGFRCCIVRLQKLDAFAQAAAVRSGVVPEIDAERGGVPRNAGLGLEVED